MSKEKKEVGPIYGVELLDSLPLDGGHMRQALPCREDLDDVRRTRINGNDRVVAGYEVLLEHYRRVVEERDRLAAIVKTLPTCYRLVDGKLVDDCPVADGMDLWYLHCDTHEIRHHNARFMFLDLRGMCNSPEAAESLKAQKAGERAKQETRRET